MDAVSRSLPRRWPFVRRTARARTSDDGNRAAAGLTLAENTEISGFRFSGRGARERERNARYPPNARGKMAVRRDG